MPLSHGEPIIDLQARRILTKMKWAAQGTGSKSMDADKSSVFQPRDMPAHSRSGSVSLFTEIFMSLGLPQTGLQTLGSIQD